MPSTALFLASNSPRRRQMLSWTGWSFVVSPADIDETPNPGEPAVDYVLRLAVRKMEAVCSRLSEGQVGVAADTIVVDQGSLLGKPRDSAEARLMLRQLRGRTHQVVTALALYDPGAEQALTDLCCADVTMRAYSDAEIEAYIASGDPLDKAGAYAIQHAGFHPVEDFRQCFACVMGLPLCHLGRSLRRLGVAPVVAIPSVCQVNLEYACPVWQEIYA
jgi:septum formation protein